MFTTRPGVAKKKQQHFSVPPVVRVRFMRFGCCDRMKTHTGTYGRAVSRLIPYLRRCFTVEQYDVKRFAFRYEIKRIGSEFLNYLRVVYTVRI